MKKEVKKIIFGTHTGTHVDAPKHFIKKGKTIDKIDLDLLTGEALVVDLSYKKFSEVSVSELKFIKKHKELFLITIGAKILIQ